MDTHVPGAQRGQESEKPVSSLPFRKKSSSSWGTLPSACSILMVMLKEKRSLCRSNSPVERWRQGLHFRTEALAWGTPKSKGNDVNSHIAKGLHLTLSASDGHGCPDAKGQSVAGGTPVCTWHGHINRSHIVLEVEDVQPRQEPPSPQAAELSTGIEAWSSQSWELLWNNHSERCE